MSKSHNRREFLKHSAAGAAALALGSCTQSWEVEPDAGPANPKLRKTALPDSVLSQVSGEGVPADLDGALTKLMAPLGGLGYFVKPGQSVLIKPNMSFARPASYRATTSAELIAALARAVLALKPARVIVADYPVSDVDEVMEAMGLKKALAGLKVEIPQITSDSPFVTTPLPLGKELKEVDYLKLALDADVHIALPVAKSHSSAGFTGALKGAMGLIRSRKSFHWLHDLHQAVVDINTGIRPQLTIVEGIEVMSTEGPQGPGKLIRCDSLIASNDPVSADAAAVRLARLHGKKIKPKRIRHLALAQSAGLGAMDPAAKNVHRMEIPASQG